MARNRYVALALITALLAIPWSVSAQGDVVARVIPDKLNVRETPSRDAPAVGQFAANTELRVTGREDNRQDDGIWVFATPLADGIGGWVRSDFLEFPPEFNFDVLPVIDATGVGALPSPAAAPPVAEMGDIGLLSGETAQNVNFRTGPDMLFAVIRLLPAGTSLALTGRTADSKWVQAMVEGQTGWLYARLLTIGGDLNSLPVITGPEPAPASVPNIPAGVVPALGGRPRQIFLTGQSFEPPNNPRAFSKVGDSITHAVDFLYQMGWGNYQLGEYGHLQSVIWHFITAEHNSFAHQSRAAYPGWTSYNLLRPGGGDLSVCGPDETPLDCEYRLTRPAVALIMIGTNDIAMGVDSASYRTNLERIVQISIDHGVVPVLSTLPDNLSNPEGYAQALAFNAMIAEVAAAYGIPLWDYWRAMQSLPNKGMGGDNYHPSVDVATGNAATFTPEGLQYGYTMRNLTALMVLDAVWKGALY